jgi:hypothetical protein
VEHAEKGLEVSQIREELTRLRHDLWGEKDKRREEARKESITLSEFRRSRDVSTTLRPIGPEMTTQLLCHGYYVAMANASLMLDCFPFMKPFPKTKDFEALASGKP